MSKEDRKDLVDLKLAFEVNEWEDFLLVLNEIRDRDKDIVAMYRKKYLDEKKSKKAYADEVNNKLVALLELVLEDNYCLDNNHEIAPVLRDKIEKTLKQLEDGK